MSTSVSLIITTYNWKEALQRVIETVFNQTVLPNEVIVADDGSRSDTRQLIESMQKISPVPIIHIWQKDEGFRAATSRNKAIAAANSEYIVSIDGDILLHKRFIADHLQAARKKQFVAGKRCLVAPLLTLEILNGAKTKYHSFSKGLINRKNAINSKLLSKLFSKQVKGLKGIKTCNLGFWKADAIAINGFNEDINGWGLEDSEFAKRLMNNDIKAYSIRFQANCFHLHHPVLSRDMYKQNKIFLQYTIDEKLTWCANGIDKYTVLR